MVVNTEWTWQENPYITYRLEHKIGLQQLIGGHTSESKYVQVPQGEHLGPIVIEEPMHLMGKGRETVLWNYQSPILVILSPGVTLENLHFEFSLDVDAPHIIHLDGCEPTLVACDQTQLRISPMINQDMINLGKVAAGTEVELPILFSSQDSWDGAGKVYNAKFGKLKRGVFDRHGFNLKVKAPNDDGYIIEPFPITSSSDGNSKNLILFGRVVERFDSKPLNKVLVLKLSDGRRKVYFNKSTIITPQQLELLSGISAAPVSNTMFIKDSLGNWCFWMPYKVGKIGSALIDGNNYTPWTREILSKGKSFKFGTYLAFTVDQEDGIPLQVQETVDVSVQAGASMEVKIPISLTPGIANILNKWSGQVKPLHDWIKVKSGDVNLVGAIRSGASNHEIVLEITPNLSNLDNGEYFYPNAIAIANEKEIVFVDLNLKIHVASHRVAINPKVMEIKSPDRPDLYAGELSGIEMAFRVVSQGRDETKVSITTSEPWLEIPEKAQQFTLPAGQSVDVPFRLTNQANALPFDEAFESKHAIIIKNEDDPNNIEYLALKARIQRPRKPQIGLISEPQPLAKYNLDNPKTLGTIIELQNNGYAAGEYRIEAPDIVEIDQIGRTGKLAHNETAQCKVRIQKDYLETLPEGHQETVEIRVVSGTDQMNLSESARFNLKIEVIDLYPVIKIEPSTFDFDKYVENQPISGEVKITVHNQGSDAYKGTLVTKGGWFTVEQPDIRLKPGESTSVTLKLNQQARNLKPGVHTIPNCLNLQSNQQLRKNINVEARIVIQAAEPLIHVHQDFLWFGKIEQGDTRLPTAELILGNYGTKDWRGHVSVIVPWITVNQTDLRIPQGKVLRIPVYINSAIEDSLSAGAHYFDDAVIIADNQTQQAYHLGARLFIAAPRPDLVIKPSRLDFGCYLQGSSTLEPKRIVLHNQGRLKWVCDLDKSVSPDWLKLSNNFPHELAPGEKVAVEVSFNPDFLNQQGDYTDWLILRDKEMGECNLHVTAKVEPVNIVVEPDQLEIVLTSWRRGSGNNNEKNKLTVHNLSNAPFRLEPANYGGRGNFLYEEWIQISPSADRTISPGEKVVFTLTCNDEYIQGQFQDAITITLPNGDVNRIDINVVRS